MNFNRKLVAEIWTVMVVFYVRMWVCAIVVLFQMIFIYRLGNIISPWSEHRKLYGSLFCFWKWTYGHDSFCMTSDHLNVWRNFYSGTDLKDTEIIIFTVQSLETWNMSAKSRANYTNLCIKYIIGKQIWEVLSRLLTADGFSMRLDYLPSSAQYCNCFLEFQILV